MPRLGYVVLHTSWGALRWSEAEGRCVSAPVVLGATDDARGVRGAALWRSLSDARHAIGDTADYVATHGGDGVNFARECSILPVEADHA